MSIILLTGIVVSQYCLAETRYVTDTLLLTLREGPGEHFPVEKVLKSNDPVTVIEERNDYLKVRTKDGSAGWVEKKYIVDEIPKPVVIENLEKKIATLESRIQALLEQNKTLESRYNELQKTLSGRIKALESQLEAARSEKEKAIETAGEIQKAHDALVKNSRNVLEIQAENQDLAKKNKDLSSRITEMESRVDNQLKTGMIKWFMAGVGVLLAGWLMGKSLVSKKRRSGGLLN